MGIETRERGDGGQTRGANKEGEPWGRTRGKGQTWVTQSSQLPVLFWNVDSWQLGYIG